VKFSIILPVKNRPVRVARAINSVINQHFEDWELIVVDDYSDDETPNVLKSLAKHESRIKIITNEETKQRAISRNRGMREAEGEWICWMDSDDEYLTNYLKSFDEAIKSYPDYSVFNARHLICHPEDTHIKPSEPFSPKKEKIGHEWFPNGNIGTGMFIFKRELLEDKDMWIPEEQSPYQFAANSGIPMKREDYPEAFQDNELIIGISLGNPWGDDYCQFYYLTRKHHSKPLKTALYKVYPRSSEEEFKDKD